MYTTDCYLLHLRLADQLTITAMAFCHNEAEPPWYNRTAPLKFHIFAKTISIGCPYVCVSLVVVKGFDMFVSFRWGVR